MSWTSPEGLAILDLILEGTTAKLRGRTIICKASEKAQVKAALINNRFENDYQFLTKEHEGSGFLYQDFWVSAEEWGFKIYLADETDAFVCHDLNEVHRLIDLYLSDPGAVALCEEAEEELDIQMSDLTLLTKEEPGIILESEDDGCEGVTYLKVYQVKDYSKGSDLYDLYRDDPSDFRIYMDELFGIQEDWNVAPGARFHRHDVHMAGPGIIAVFDHVALNI